MDRWQNTAVLETALDVARFFPRKEAVEETSTGYVARKAYNEYQIWKLSEHESYVQRTWHELYRAISDQVVKMSIGRDAYLVTRMTPKIREAYYGSGFPLTEFIVQAEMFYATERNFVIPIVTYDEQFRAIEWRCGYCNSPNVIEERHCSQCGAPRALLIQEM